METEEIIESSFEKEEIPQTSFSNYLLTRLREGLPKWGSRPWVVDVGTGKSILFNQVDDQSRRIASALNRRGFRPGDILFYVTYEMAQMYVVQLAAWRLGGAVRGFFQAELPEEYTQLLHESRSRLVLVDAETAPLLREAIADLDWSVQLINVSDKEVADTISIAQLLQDDGAVTGKCLVDLFLDCPENVDVDIHEDIVMIPNTSGSTGRPKGVLHTHYTTVGSLVSLNNFLPKDSLMASTMNYASVNFCTTTHALTTGCTVYNIPKFKKEDYFGLLLKYKPRTIVMYPYVASWFARCSHEMALLHDANFLDSIAIGGWVLDYTTAKLLAKELPNTSIAPMYGQSECSYISYTPPGNALKINEMDGQKDISCGKLLPRTRAKVVDPNTGKVLGRGQQGEILINSPYVMKGYLMAGEPPYRTNIDAEGWIRTGDIGYFDAEDNIYIKERLSFVFKFNMHFISPSELESVLHEHPAIEAAGVVGLPNPETDNLARAFVVVKSGCQVSTADLHTFMASRLPPHKYLHGGIRFVDALPVNRGSKLDRVALRILATEQGDRVRTISSSQ